MMSSFFSDFGSFFPFFFGFIAFTIFVFLAGRVTKKVDRQ